MQLRLWNCARSRLLQNNHTHSFVVVPCCSFHVYHSRPGHRSLQRKTEIHFQINNKLSRYACQWKFERNACCICGHSYVCCVAAENLGAERMLARRYTNKIRKFLRSTYFGPFEHKSFNNKKNNKNNNNFQCKYKNYVFDRKTKSSLRFGIRRKNRTHNMFHVPRMSEQLKLQRENGATQNRNKNRTLADFYGRLDGILDADKNIR